MRNIPHIQKGGSCFMQSIKKLIFATTLFVFLAGCSSQDNQAKIEQLMNENEKIQTELNLKIDQLNAENQELRNEISAASDELHSADQKIKELEEELSNSSEIETTVAEIQPRQLEPTEALIGEWFYPEFRQNSLIDNWIQSLVFRADGTGTITRTFYLPTDITESDYSTSDPLNEVSQGFSWTLSGDQLHTVFDGDTHFVDYTFLPSEQQLRIINEGGEVRDGSKVYVREMPDIPKGYVESIVITKNIEAQEAALSRKFLGNWYFDVTTWTFNEDGTGFIDIPALVDQPAAKRTFSYTVTCDGADMMVTFQWDDTDETYFYTTFNPDGSMSLEAAGRIETINLTRTFDVDNCPISKEIIQNGIAVLTGSIFEDFFP